MQEEATQIDSLRLQVEEVSKACRQKAELVRTYKAKWKRLKEYAREKQRCQQEPRLQQAMGELSLSTPGGGGGSRSLVGGTPISAGLIAAQQPALPSSHSTALLLSSH